MLFDWNLPINAFEDFSKTTYAEDKTPNTKEDCVKKNFIGSRKVSKILFHKFSL